MNKPKSFDVQIEGGELVIRVRLEPEAADDLIPITPEGLAPLGLELTAVRRLVAEGTLKAVAVGRRRYTRRSMLVALVDQLPAARAAEGQREALDDLADVVARHAQRLARREARRAKANADRAE